ncbi:MAG: hypothetical protein WC215_02850 [Bacilli bacterium]
MAETIKGLNIKLGLDTTELDLKLKNVTTELKEEQKDLRAINNALKFDSSNVSLWKDKQDGRNEGIIMSDIGYIKSSTERIEKRLDKLEGINTDINTRVVVLENEVKNLKSKRTLAKETR